MKKKLNPAWFYLIVALALIPCCEVHNRFGFMLNVFGVGLGEASFTPEVVRILFTILYLCLMIYLISSLFRKKYGINVFLPVVLIALLRISMGFQWFGISGDFAREIIKLHFALTVIYNVAMVLFTAVNVFPSFEQIKVKQKYLWILPLMLVIFKYIVGIATCTAYIYFDGEIKESFVRTFLWLKNGGMTIYHKAAFAGVIADVIATALFSYNLSMREYVAQKKSQASPRGNTEYTKFEYDAYCDMAKHILLCIFTFGIWQCIWVWRTTKFLNQAPKAEQYNPTKKLLLCMFVPFYMIYWFYKHGQRIDMMYKDKNLGNSDMVTLCLILGIFIPIVAYIVMQEKINTLCTAEAAVINDDINDNNGINFEALNKLKDLLDSGIITQEEFEQKKKQLLHL